MKIAAIIILYFPDEERLEKVIDLLIDQVDEIFIVDNTPEIYERDLGKISRPKIIYKALKENKGIAEAQNIGVTLALKNNANYLLFLDQDSIPSADLVKTLLYSWNYLHNKGEKIAVIGPGIKSNYGTGENKARISKGEKIGDDILKVSKLISSGSMISSHVWYSIGKFESSLFIDGVDSEWCWRAQKEGLQCFKVNAILLNHQFGTAERKLLGMEIPIPSPQRCYYLYRNYLLLIRRRYVPFYWKASYLLKLTFRLPYYSFFIKPHNKYFNNIMKGIKDGIKVYYGRPV